jgi:hypothetical protein
MKTSFAQPATKPKATTKPTEVNEEPKEEGAIIEAPVAQLAVNTLAGQVEGEFSAKDFTVPRLNLVAKTGELSNTFQPGAFVYNREVVIGDGKKPAKITFLRIQKIYMQDVVYGSDQIAKTFSRLADVRAAGGALANDPEAEADTDRYTEALQTIVAIEAPDKDNPLFPFAVGDCQYGLAQYLMAKSAYRSAGKQVFTDSQLFLKAGLHTACYELTSKIRTSPSGSYFVPHLKISSKHSPECCEQLKAIFG